MNETLLLMGLLILVIDVVRENFSCKKGKLQLSNKTVDVDRDTFIVVSKRDVVNPNMDNTIIDLPSYRTVYFTYGGFKVPVDVDSSFIQGHDRNYHINLDKYEVEKQCRINLGR